MLSRNVDVRKKNILPGSMHVDGTSAKQVGRHGLERGSRGGAALGGGLLQWASESISRHHGWETVAVGGERGEKERGGREMEERERWKRKMEVR